MLREAPSKLDLWPLMLREGPTHNSRIAEINGPVPS